MKNALRLALRYLAFHRGRTLVLSTCLLLTFLLPLTVERFLDSFGTLLVQRAEETPLVAGSKGSRFDLVLNALYFRGRVPEATSMAEVDQLAAGNEALVVPILCRRTARGFPIVGTTADYFAFRGLHTERGSAPLVLGDVCLGWEVARELGLEPGSPLLTDRGSLYDLGAGYPLRARVSGVLERTGGPDAHAVICDIKTAWIVDGIGHGHRDAATADKDQILRRTDQGVVLSPAIVEYEEITPENLDDFHFHGERDSLPVTSILVLPHTPRDSTVLKGRYRVASATQLLVSRDVIDEVLGFVFQLKLYFDANVALVSVATLLFLGLVVLLSLRLREREFETLYRIGCARLTVARIFAAELAILLLAGWAGAWILSIALASWLEDWALS